MVSIVWLEGSEKEIWCHGFFLLSSHFSSLPRIGGTEKVTEKIRRSPVREGGTKGYG